jgi:hypothetical protein
MVMTPTPQENLTTLPLPIISTRSRGRNPRFPTQSRVVPSLFLRRGDNGNAHREGDLQEEREHACEAGEACRGELNVRSVIYLVIVLLDPTPAIPSVVSSSADSQSVPYLNSERVIASGTKRGCPTCVRASPSALGGYISGVESQSGLSDLSESDGDSGSRPSPASPAAEAT